MKPAREQSAARSVPFGMVAAGLACLFAGIWTSDGAALTLLEPPGGDLAMRVSSLIVYIALFVGVRRRMRGARAEQRDLKRFLIIAAGAALVAYAFGTAIMLSAGPFDGSTRAVVASLAFFLLKGIGAPLSVALVCLSATLPYRLVAQVSALGILGAFVLKEAAEALAAFAQLGDVGAFAVGSVLIAAAAGLVIAALQRQRSVVRLDASAEPPEERATVLLPFRTLANRNLVVGVVVASMMLGFLRSSSSIGPVDSPPAVMVALVLIIAAIGLVPSIGVHELFRGALVCTAAGFLLGPVLDLFATGGGDVLVSIGTSLFEVVVWVVAVVIVRSCTEPLLAAAAARLVIVVGHLAGAALGMLAEAWARVDATAPEAFSLVIVFAYVIMLVYLFNDPVAKLPFTAGRFAAPQPAAPVASSPTTASCAPAAPAAAAAPSAGAPAPSDPDPWEARCTAVAREHNLTPRETDVLEQLARGRDLAFMEEKFVLSRNTVKMHIKHVYEKLGVHSKQEVIDLVESARPQS